MKKKQILIRMHPAKHHDLKVLAAKANKSINFAVELAISMLLANPEKILIDKK